MRHGRPHPAPALFLSAVISPGGTAEEGGASEGLHEELAGAVAGQLDGLRARLRERGMGLRVGCGQRPAVLVVDLVRGFTDTRLPPAGEFGAELEVARRLLGAAREAGATQVKSVNVRIER